MLTGHRNSKYFFLQLLFLIFLSGCAGSKYQRIEGWQKQGQFEEIIRSDVDCSRKTIDCFRIKSARAESYYHLANYRQALLETEQAQALIPPDLSLPEINQFYLLRGRIVFERLDSLDTAEERTDLLRRLESDLRDVIRRNSSPQSSDQLADLYLFLAQTLVKKMADLSGKNLDIVYDHLVEVTRDFPEDLKQDGYDKFYLLSGQYQRIDQALNTWRSQGNPYGTRENLLVQLKEIYTQGVALRNLPIYEQGLAEQIDLFLARVDQHMKQLIL